MKRLRPIAFAVMVVWIIFSVLSFFGLTTYCIITPGSTGTGFSDPTSAVDPVQQQAMYLWFVWGLIGACAAAFGYLLTTYPSDR